jgi:hypothetical protein
MTDLIKRLEEARSGSRELDADIGRALGMSQPPYFRKHWPRYTTWLNISLTLIPPEWWLEHLTQRQGNGGWGAQLRRTQPVDIVYTPLFVATPCLAVSAASLRARASQ